MQGWKKVRRRVFRGDEESKSSILRVRQTNGGQFARFGRTLDLPETNVACISVRSAGIDFKGPPRTRMRYQYLIGTPVLSLKFVYALSTFQKAFTALSSQRSMSRFVLIVASSLHV